MTISPLSLMPHASSLMGPMPSTSACAVRALSFPAALVLMSAQASCLGSKDSLSPTLATLTASVVNVLGDTLLVLG